MLPNINENDILRIKKKEVNARISFANSCHTFESPESLLKTTSLNLFSEQLRKLDIVSNLT